MDHRFKCKISKDKTFKWKQRRTSLETRARWRVLRYHTQSIIHSRKTHKLDFIKLKNFCSAKDPPRGWKDKTQTGRKCLQTKEYFGKYCKSNICRRLVKKNRLKINSKEHIIQLENGQKTLKYISIKMIYRWQIKIYST